MDFRFTYPRYVNAMMIFQRSLITLLNILNTNIKSFQLMR